MDPQQGKPYGYCFKCCRLTRIRFMTVLRSRHKVIVSGKCGTCDEKVSFLLKKAVK